jgi:hypothetical protein
MNSWTVLQLWTALAVLAFHNWVVDGESIQVNQNKIGKIKAGYLQNFGFIVKRNESICGTDFQRKDLKKKECGMPSACAFQKLESVGNFLKGASIFVVDASCHQKQILLDLHSRDLIPANSSTQGRYVSLEYLCSRMRFSKLSLGAYSLHAKRSACEVDFSRNSEFEYCREAVFLLDLDKCSFFGNDANDLGVAFQWTQKSKDELVALYRLLVNPR